MALFLKLALLALTPFARADETWTISQSRFWPHNVTVRIQHESEPRAFGCADCVQWKALLYEVTPGWTFEDDFGKKVKGDAVHWAMFQWSPVMATRADQGERTGANISAGVVYSPASDTTLTGGKFSIAAIPVYIGWGWNRPVAFKFGPYVNASAGFLFGAGSGASAGGGLRASAGLSRAYHNQDGKIAGTLNVGAVYHAVRAKLFTGSTVHPLGKGSVLGLQVALTFL